MCKKIVILPVVIIVLFALSSCNNIFYNNGFSYPEDLKNKVICASYDENGNANDKFIKYSEQEYHKVERNLFYFPNSTNGMEPNDGDVLLGWDRNLLYTSAYYSETTVNPLYIYETNTDNVYLRNNYNYESLLFAIDKTDITVIFKKALIPSDFGYDVLTKYKDETAITLYSIETPKLQIKLTLFYENKHWYAGGNSPNIIFELSQEFIILLKKHNIIHY